MAKNEVGEFELVLGNKQLLSVFFIVVILLGVFFMMGYIVGRNSAPPTIEAMNRKDGKPTVIDSPNAPTPSQVPTATEPAATEPKKEEPSAPAETPKASEPKPEVKPEPKPEPKKEEPKKPEPAKPEPKKEATPAPAPASNGAISGTYLQLAAVPKAEADLLVSVLRKKGFSSVAGPGPEGSNLFRVLVGPLAGAEAISKTRESLNEAGMQGTKAIIRKF